MKKAALITLALMMTACATTKTYQAAPQFYRAKGSDNQIQITGKIQQDFKDNFFNATVKNHVTVYFDGNPQADGYLDASQTGEFSGEPYQGKPVSVSCSSKPVTKGWVELKCIVFIDNERTATLIM